MSRWMQWCVLVAICSLVPSCSRDPQSPDPDSRKRLWILETALGPVDVLDVREDSGGGVAIRVHAVFPDGGHVVRTIRFAAEAPPDPAGGRGTLRTVEGGDARLRVMRMEGPGRFETHLETGTERLRLSAEAVERGFRLRADLERGEGARTWESTLTTERAGDPVYRASIEASLAAFYGGGSLRENRDLRLLAALEQSPSWGGFLEAISVSGTGIDAETRRRIQRVCVGAAVASKISCFVSRFTPWGMVVCVPSTGISLACLLYNVAQLGTAPDPPRCDCGCPCRR